MVYYHNSWIYQCPRAIIEDHHLDHLFVRNPAQYFFLYNYNLFKLRTSPEVINTETLNHKITGHEYTFFLNALRTCHKPNILSHM